MKRRTLTLVVALVAAVLGGAEEARAADECRGLQVCLPVPGPWVAIPVPTGSGVPTVTWELRCPLRGYIVGRARLARSAEDGGDGQRDDEGEASTLHRALRNQCDDSAPPRSSRRAPPAANAEVTSTRLRSFASRVPSSS